MPNPIEELRSAGVPVDSIPEEQREVLANLSEHEVGVLKGLKDRLGQDVQAHGAEGAEGIGVILW
ncbi:hypothetical protein G5C60_17935 [Streptomyces sp. HC44]|uniref:Uncharacterized protein n=1 Tax=Streptomyces scabichelini TaxID=2711217 RepID=A0A6G4V679_9ACTN|nr:aroma-sacti cluster domain-containing protein [Streptomyces scabichelini]NGO09425.1 hypothetical protein [Streptomyces scabichelini]